MLNIAIHNKTYSNGCCAIANLEFSAAPGEFVALVGPSGAGKSTLLNIVSGIDPDFSGSIQFAGQNVHSKQVRLGFLFQEPRLMPWLTVQQNLMLVLNQQPEKTTSKSIDDWLADVGLQGCGALFPSQLSGGMQRRVALLRSFIVKPDLLLMDEPFQSLDAPTADQLRSLLNNLWCNSAPTVLFVTHNLREAISVANRIVFLSARPSRVILDHTIDQPQPRHIEDDFVLTEHRRLLEKYPKLLEGYL